MPSETNTSMMGKCPQCGSYFIKDGKCLDCHRRFEESTHQFEKWVAGFASVKHTNSPKCKCNECEFIRSEDDHG